jgi:nucleoside-diphosphate-sugar epimerase
MQTAEPSQKRRAATLRRRLGRPRLLIVGCGDIGLRIVARLRDRFRIYGSVRDAAGAGLLRRAGAIPLALDLDRAGAQPRIRGLAPWLVVLVPTSPEGTHDARVPHLLRSLRHEPGKRLLYLSTTGVYGDRRGAWTDETATPAPASERAVRRLGAERRLRARPWHAPVLRVPGIYAPDRLPLERLRRGIPVPLPAEDVVTNHIHADDLARACIAALFRAAPARVYNIVDDTRLALGEYLDRVADRTALPRPPRAAWEEMRAAAGPQRMTFLSESRRLRNRRMKRELRLRLRYPDVDAGLAAMDQASNRPSTDR